MIELLTPQEIERARPAGRFVAHTLQTLKRRVEPGTNLLDIDRWAADLIRAEGAASCYVDYSPSFGRGPFGRVICTSVNDAVLHGLPHDRRLQEGDLVSLDFAVSVDGWVADAAVSFVVGDGGDPKDHHMIATTEAALAQAIQAAVPGNRVGDVSAAIGAVLSAGGYVINTDFGGHGVGSTMHQEPHFPNEGRPGRGARLVPGMLVALEPWVMSDTDELVTDADGWTLRSSTGGRGSHSEHTVAITEDGPIVMTDPLQD